MEKNLSLNYDETTALLDMSVCSYADTDEEASTSALVKLGDLCREFAQDEKTHRDLPAVIDLPRAA